ncbi:hypothetical protein AB0J80_37850 [Actinoplanes sp. NPDC049548]|uniref:hypothetical protein n=1 Tax=Actinoplanes sp. NPDC049548 TaxID=3155152 RepID=UPI003415F18E
MKIHRLAAVATAAALAVSGMAVGSPAQASAKPAVVVDYAYHTVKVKPAAIWPFKDLNYSGIKWTSLTSTTGKATATRNVNTCKPTCAAGNYKHTKVKLTFSKVKLSDCHRVFSQVKETVVSSKKTATRRLPVFAKSGC